MFKLVWILAAFAVSAPPGATFAAQTARPQKAAPAVWVELPPGARFVASAELDRMHAFPEQKGKMPFAPAVAGVNAIDRVYQIDRPYTTVIGFFDRQVTEPGILELARDTTRTATAWAMVLPHGRVANVIVRNTQPTTIEVVSATRVAETPPPLAPPPLAPPPLAPPPVAPPPTAPPPSGGPGSAH
jgi:hypothetical protein